MTKATRQQFYIYRHLGIKPKNLSPKKLRQTLKLIAEGQIQSAKDALEKDIKMKRFTKKGTEERMKEHSFMWLGHTFEGTAKKYTIISVPVQMHDNGLFFKNLTDLNAFLDQLDTNAKSQEKILNTFSSTSCQDWSEDEWEQWRLELDNCQKRLETFWDNLDY